MAPLPDLSRLPQGAATGEFYPLPQDEADRLNEGGGVELLSREPYPARADRATRLDEATFRLPYPESAPRNPDGSYRYRVYNAHDLWQWVRQPGKEFDPADGAGPDRTRLLKSDWEALRDEFSTPRRNPTPDDSVFRAPIPNGLWPPRDPDAPAEVPEQTDMGIVALRRQLRVQDQERLDALLNELHWLRRTYAALRAELGRCRVDAQELRAERDAARRDRHNANLHHDATRALLDAARDELFQLRAARSV